MTDNPQEKLCAWTPEKIGWYSEACEYSGNDRNSKLAEVILDALPPDPYICDIGCGTGALSLELAKKASKVTAVDENKYALNYLRRTVKNRGIDNIEVIQGDFSVLKAPSTKADCAVFCMIGVNGYIDEAKRWADGKAIIITNPTDCHSFASKIKKNEKERAEKLRAYLLKNKFSFSECMVSTSSGQPFRNLEDAVRFISSYDSEKDYQDILDMLGERLVETDRTDYPLYLPNNKDYLIFSIDL